METITIQVFKDDVYEEVAKATDYTGAKLIDGDEKARDRILATDNELSDLGRFWEESVLATNERLKEMLVSGTTKDVQVSTDIWGMNPAKRNVLDLKNETCKNREKRNVLKNSHTRHFKAIKKQSKTGCFYSF